MTGMDTRTRKLVFGAALAAIAVAILYISSVAPGGRLAMIAVAGLACAVALVETGAAGAVLVYAASAILSLLILPAKSSAIAFAVFFGIYPIIKSCAERLTNRAVEWTVKVVVFYIGLILMVWLAKGLFWEGEIASWIYALIAVLGGVVFVLYDIAMTRVITLYVRRVSKRLGGRGKRG